jgi:hypothetical protein
MPRPWAAIAGLAALAVLAAPAGARAPVTAQARLAGRFALTGRVTYALSIPGEHTGQQVSRTWVFTARCPSGRCARELLVRGRGPGMPRVSLTLALRGPGYYVGRGVFYAPLRCGGRIYRPGERVHYRVGVRITAAGPVLGQLLATSIRASYASGTRDNLTPCVALIGQRDAATYQGSLAG